MLPSESVDADPSKATLTPTYTDVGANWNAAWGRALAVTWWVALEDWVWLPTTVKLTVNKPGFAYECVAMTPLPAVASPNSHVYETIVPSGSNEADASNITGTPGFTRNGLAVKSATGGCGPGGGGWTTKAGEAGPVRGGVVLTVRGD